MLRTLVLCLILVFTSACRLLPTRDGAYVQSQQGNELRIPSSLDTPYTESRLRIPEAPTLEAPLAGNFTRPPSNLMAIAGDLPQFSGTELVYEDSVDNLWRRVGLALDRSAGLTVLDRDQERLAYRVQVASAEIQDQRSWFGRMVGRAAPTQAGPLPPVWVRLYGDAERSQVRVQDDGGNTLSDLRASSVLGVIKNRLG